MRAENVSLRLPRELSNLEKQNLGFCLFCEFSYEMDDRNKDGHESLWIPPQCSVGAPPCLLNLEPGHWSDGVSMENKCMDNLTMVAVIIVNCLLSG